MTTNQRDKDGDLLPGPTNAEVYKQLRSCIESLIEASVNFPDSPYRQITLHHEVGWYDPLIQRMAAKATLTEITDLNYFRGRVLKVETSEGKNFRLCLSLWGRFAYASTGEGYFRESDLAAWILKELKDHSVDLLLPETLDAKIPAPDGSGNMSVWAIFFFEDE